MSSVRGRMRDPGALSVGLLVPLALAGAAVVLLRFPPESTSVYPVCPVFRFLHILCPGCGTTRAISALLRGNVVAAWHDNPLTMSLLPVALVYLLTGYVRLVCGRPARLSPVPLPVSCLLLAVAAAFTIVRNLPWAS